MKGRDGGGGGVGRVEGGGGTGVKMEGEMREGRCLGKEDGMGKKGGEKEKGKKRSGENWIVGE